jgi:hypothetical protein
MILKTHKDAYKNVASKLELNEDLITLIGNFIYEEFGKSLDNFEHRENYMLGLGVFRFRKKRSLEYIGKVENIKEQMLKMGRPLEYAEIAEQRTKPKIEKMMKLVKDWDELMAEKEKFKIRKQKYYADRDIQEQNTDLGGTKE